MKDCKLDLIVPYFSINKNMAWDIVSDLRGQQSIEKINVIFICDGNQEEYQILNTVMKNLGVDFTNIFHDHVGQAEIKNFAINLSEYSSEYICFWDFDDGFFSKYVIETMLNLVVQNKLDITSFLSYNFQGHKKCINVYKRSFITSFGISFPDIPKEEDTTFTMLASYLAEKTHLYEIVIGRWNAFLNPSSRTNVCSTVVLPDDNDLYSLLYFYFQYFYVTNKLALSNKSCGLQIPSVNFLRNYIDTTQYFNEILTLSQLIIENKFDEFISYVNIGLLTDNKNILKLKAQIIKEVINYRKLIQD